MSLIFKKPEKIVGYMLLVVGLIVVIIPTYIGISVIFTGASAIPEILEAPTLSFDDVTIPIGDESIIIPISDADINEIMESTFPSVNLGLFLVLAVILISAGSVIMGKGVGLIKEVKLKTEMSQ